jgi:hypothetical protein
MMIQIVRNSSSRWMRVQSVLAGLLCVMGLPVLVLALGNLLPVDAVAAPRG